jgi:hypothetical protein
MSMLPAAAGTCPDCATAHPPEQPHNAQSLFYQVQFNGRHGRFATWHDAMRHCTPEVKRFWLDHLGVMLAANGLPPVGEDLHAAESVPEPLAPGALVAIGTAVDIAMDEPDDDEDFDEDAWCDTCGNLGSLNCRCGGDICCCENQGEIPCPDCTL